MRLHSIFTQLGMFGPTNILASFQLMNIKDAVYTIHQEGM